jgi:hypothetical protein
MSSGVNVTRPSAMAIAVEKGRRQRARPFRAETCLRRGVDRPVKASGLVDAPPKGWGGRGYGTRRLTRPGMTCMRATTLRVFPTPRERVTAMRKTPPGDLSKAGKALWTETLATFDLDATEQRLLAEACRACDELDVLRRALASSEPLVEGSQGQPRPNPLYDEMRRHRDSLAKLIGALGIPSPEQQVTVSDKARAAASARWAKRTGA